MKRHIPTISPFVPAIAAGMSIAFIQLDLFAALRRYGPGREPALAVDRP